jgi:hypothetical protein
MKFSPHARAIAEFVGTTDFLRKPCCHSGTLRKQHLRRDSSGGRTALRDGTAFGSCHCNFLLSVGFSSSPLKSWKLQALPHIVG